MTLGGHIVWLDLGQPAGAAQLSKVDGPLALTLTTLDAAQLKPAQGLAQRFPTDIRFYPNRPEPSDLRPLGTLQNARGLSIYTSSPSVQFPDLRSDSRLERVYVFSNAPTDPLLPLLPSGLKSLSIFGPLGAASFSKLDRFSALETLALGGDALDARALAKLKRLKELTLMLPLGDTEFALIAELEQLERLSVARSEFTAAAGPHLAKLKQLKQLDLLGSTVAPEALSKLGTLSHLTQLGLPRADEQIMKYVVTLPQLTRFSAPQVVGGRALELVSGMSQLRELDLSQTALGASEVRLLGKLESLEGLTLNTIQAPGSLAPLSKLRHLRRLSLAHSQLNAADVGVIAQLSELRELDLSDTSLTDAGLEALSKLKQLRVLYIDRTAITRQGQATLLSFPKLTFTGVDGTALSCKELMTASTRLTCQGR